MRVLITAGLVFLISFQTSYLFLHHAIHKTSNSHHDAGLFSSEETCGLCATVATTGHLNLEVAGWAGQLPFAGKPVVRDSGAIPRIVHTLAWARGPPHLLL